MQGSCASFVSRVHAGPVCYQLRDSRAITIQNCIVQGTLGESSKRNLSLVMRGVRLLSPQFPRERSVTFRTPARNFRARPVKHDMLPALATERRGWLRNHQLSLALWTLHGHSSPCLINHDMLSALAAVERDIHLDALLIWPSPAPTYMTILCTKLLQA
jgi:hypothetical protein